MENKKDASNMLEQHLLSQQFNNLQQQLQTLTYQIMELENLSSDLDSLKQQNNSKTFSSLGGGIFVETEVKKSDSVLLSVGANILVKKSKEDSINLVRGQIGQLQKIKEQLESELNKMNLNLLSLK